MKKLIVIIAIMAMVGGCATMGSQSHDTDYTSKELIVTERTVSQNVWNLFSMGVQGLINAVLLSNYFIHP